MYVGIRDVALDWFISYLSNRSFSVALGYASSSHAPLFCWVPQGSILGPLLFTIYMLPLGDIMHSYDRYYAQSSTAMQMIEMFRYPFSLPDTDSDS